MIRSGERAVRVGAVSALPIAFPLALSAALYPPALLTLVLLLSGRHPRGLVLAYFAGASIMVIGAGLIALGIMQSSSSSSSNSASSSASGWTDIVIGLLLLALAAYAWKRRSRAPKPAKPTGEEGRIAQVTQRATTSQKWAFGLGLLMYLPSPMYLLAISDIAATNDSTSSKVTAVLICAIAVMLFVELPLIGMFVRPDSVKANINSFHDWLVRNGWTLTAAVAAIAGVYAIAEGIAALT
jgi:hypothetical protein